LLSPEQISRPPWKEETGAQGPELSPLCSRGPQSSSEAHLSVQPWLQITAPTSLQLGPVLLDYLSLPVSSIRLLWIALWDSGKGMGWAGSQLY
jgi:hypothetical protein